MLQTFLRIARKGLFVTAVLALLAVGGAIAALYETDRSWWGTLVGFGPRWVFIVPLGGLLPAILVVAAWRAFAVWLVAAGLSFWVLLDVKTPLGHLILLDGPDDLPLNVATANVEGQVKRVVPALLDLMDSAHLDLLAIEEWQSWEKLATHFPKLHAAQAGELGVVSRYPVKLIQHLPFATLALNSDGSLIRVDLQLREQQVLHVYVVHLETPREGIEDWMSKKRDATPIEWNTRVRRIESAAARRYIDEVGGQYIVLGDFNLPIESRIYRTYWGDLQNTYSTAGWGMGHTKRSRSIGVRIDHVLTSDGFEVANAEVGPPIGSDHQPMIAKLRVHPR